MSRSYKFPIWKDNDGPGRKRWYKKHYNRKMRRTKEYDMPSGNAYRKMNEPWNICDFSFYPLDAEDAKKASRK